jgi:heme exporter protein A
VLRASALSLSRGRRRLVHRAAFELHPGTWIALTGPNGSGKSSLLRALAGLLSWDEVPHLALGDEHLERLSAPPHLRLIFQGHAAGWKDALSVRENLWWQARMDAEQSGPAAIHAAVNFAMATTGVSAQAESPFGLLSAGQRRRVSLARLRCSLHAVQPHAGILLWLLDEPTTALDDQGQALMGALLADLCQRGGMAIVATHGAISGAPPALSLRLGPDSVASPQSHPQSMPSVRLAAIAEPGRVAQCGVFAEPDRAS